MDTITNIIPRIVDTLYWDEFLFGCVSDGDCVIKGDSVIGCVDKGDSVIGCVSVGDCVGKYDSTS